MESMLPWRARLEGWPIEWRDRWGHRANALEDQGHGWIEAERLAWNETLAEKTKAESVATIPMAKARTQTKFKESA